MTKLSNENPDRQPTTISIACHVHSEWSYDGKWSLAALAQELRRRGSRAAMMTEHDRGFTPEKWRDYQRACAAASSEDFLMVPGIEYSEPTNVLHLLVWGLSNFLGEGNSTSALLAGVREQRGLAVLAHPSRLDAWRHFETSWTETLLGIELWNRKTDGWAPSRAASVLLSGHKLLKFAGLDFHDRRQFFPLSMKVAIKDQVDERSILEALRNGRATPCIFGRPLDGLLNPAGAAAFSAAERIRRPLARNVRRICGTLAVVSRDWRNRRHSIAAQCIR